MSHSRDRIDWVLGYLSVLGFCFLFCFGIGFWLTFSKVGWLWFQGRRVPEDILKFLYLHWGKSQDFWLAHSLSFYGVSLILGLVLGVVVFCTWRLSGLVRVYLISQFILFLTLLDLVSKTVIFELYRDGRPRPVVEGILYFTYRENTGAAWSILAGKTVLLVSLSVVALIFLLYLFLTSRSVWIDIALILIFAGALGNLYDRAWFGYVRDFLDLNKLWPVFNLADSFIVVGAVLLFLLTARQERREEVEVEGGGSQKGVFDAGEGGRKG